MKTMKYEVSRRIGLLYLSLLAGMLLLSIPGFGLAQGPPYRQLGKKAFETAALFTAEQVTEYGLEHIFGNLSSTIYANPLSVTIYNPYYGVAHISVSENGQEWYPLRIPRGHYILLRTEYYPIVAIRTQQGHFYYLTDPGNYYVPAKSLGYHKGVRI